MRITVVGLGPGPAGWVTEAARTALTRPGARVFVRTSLHPAVQELLRPGTFESFDSLYETGATLDEVHDQMAGRLTEAGARQDVVLGVPGDGLLAEAVVARLAAGGVALDVVPGVPFLTGALSAALLETPAGVQSVDAAGLLGGAGGPEIEPSPLWPLVVTGLFSRGMAGDVKLALGRIYPQEHSLLVVHHPGLPDQERYAVALSDLDRRANLRFDHLTHVVVPAVPTKVPTGSAHGLRAVVARLRAPEIGCPWDLEQTHESLIPFVIEEAYEVVDAIREGTSADLMEELGDLLLQVVLHAEMADQEGDFELNDVMRGISEKLIRRHPHVFAEVSVNGAADVLRNWDALKAAEKGEKPDSASALDGLPKSLPALKQATEMGRRAVKAGFEWPNRGGAVAKMREEVEELLAAESRADRFEEFGDVLWMLAYLADAEGVDAEEALRAASKKFAVRFRKVEGLARQLGWTTLKGHSPEELQRLWQEAKRGERARLLAQ